MTDSEQAARLAAMRARRGQTPIDLPVTRAQQVPVAQEQWSSPSVTVRRGRTRRPHVAAGARIIMTGVAASSVFGLTTVIAAANQPAATSAVTPPFGAPVAADTIATAPVAVDPTLAVAGPAGDSIELIIPAIVDTTAAAMDPGIASVPVPGAIPGPAPATPAQAPATPVATATPAAVAAESAVPAPVVTAPAATAPADTPPPAPVDTPPPAPVATQPPPPPPTTAAPSGG